jgi:hypothetical protein
MCANTLMKRGDYTSTLFFRYFSLQKRLQYVSEYFSDFFTLLHNIK